MQEWESHHNSAFIVVPILKEQEASPENIVEEAVSLVQAIQLEVTWSDTLNIRRIHPGKYFGKGQIENVKAAIETVETPPDIIIVNTHLSPVQQRNLEKAWNAKVIDRTGLILEIFGERAQTKEGTLQVELAALEYQKSRLVRSWTHLERQRGGAGFMGGPGERQIEIDRRLIAERITKIKKEIDQVRKNRSLQREARDRIPYPIVALVGYTNAGKSSLFNHLTDAKVMAKDLLFATLDTTMRKVVLDNKQDIILADTVGFIVDLPTELVAAFRATLEQVEYADIILHIQDVSNPDHENQRTEVNKILKSLNINPDSDHIFHIYNKVDLLKGEALEDIKRDANFSKNTILTSAITGQGSGELLQDIQDFLQKSQEIYEFVIPAKDGKAIAWLHEHTDVLDVDHEETNMMVKSKMSKPALDKFQTYFKYEPQI